MIALRFVSSIRAMVSLTIMLAVLLVAIQPILLRAEEARYYTHISERGDNLSKIAKRYMLKVSNWTTLQSLNHVTALTAIKIGTPIRIPVELMRSESTPAKVISVSGIAESGSVALQPGSMIKQGDKLTTGENSFVSLQLADGSIINVQPKTAIEISSARQFVNTGGVSDSVVSVKSGRVETSVAKQKGPAARYEIRTPTSNMAVRGTVFRVSADESGKIAKSEVIEGAVAVNSSGGNASQNAREVNLGAGFGSIIEAGKPPSEPIALLVSPQFTLLASSFTAVPVVFQFPAINDAVSYRAQIATDMDFKNMLRESVSSSAEFKYQDLPDGELYLRIRAIDKQGLEGKSATHKFSVKIHPIPPQAKSPGPNDKLLTTTPKFTWLASPDAKSYHIQVATDPGFFKRIMDKSAVTETSMEAMPAMPRGRYFWRLASVTANNETGDYGEVQTFSIEPLQALKINFTGMTALGAKELRWDGEAGKSYQFQIAKTDSFVDVVRDVSAKDNFLSLMDLSVNTYYLRWRDSDTGAGWSQSERFDIYPLR